jgi:tetratricopeptide (TPR) repeat protein
MFQRVQFLAYTGRLKEALALVEELSATSPLLPWIQSARANLLAANDRPEEAQRVAESASRIWPCEHLTWYTRFYLYAFQGLPDRALAMAADRSALPESIDTHELELATTTAQAMVTRSVRDVDRAIEKWHQLAPSNPAFAEQAIRSAAALGRPEEAMRFAQMLYADNKSANERGSLLPKIGATGSDERNTAPLFFPPTAATFWQQPDFMPLMTRIGLLAYWRKTVTPDFCRHADVAPTCASAGLK